MYSTPHKYSSHCSSTHIRHTPNGNRDSINNQGSRKRPRDYFSTPTSSAQPCSRPAQQSPIESPPPLANSQFLLKNGLDTPGVLASEQQTPYEADTRHRSFFNTTPYSPTEQPPDYVSAQAPHPLQRERNGAARKRLRMGSLQSSAAVPETWTSFAWRLTTGAAKGLWNFCSNTNFSGFQAGGGQAYKLSRGSPPQVVQQQLPDRSTPIPGCFPEEGDDDYMRVEHSPLSAEQRPAKRQKGDWVIVDRQTRTEQPHSTALSLTPTSISRSSSRSRLPRPTSNRIVSGSAHKRLVRPSLARTRVSSVSYAQTSTSPSQQHMHEQASTASMRSPQSSPQRANFGSSIHRGSLAPARPFTPTKQAPVDRTSDPKNRSPSSAESIAKYQAKRAKDEKRADASMSRLDRQLRDLIREGQAALASSYEIEKTTNAANDEIIGDGTAWDSDEGFYDGAHVGIAATGGASWAKGRAW